MDPVYQIVERSDDEDTLPPKMEDSYYTSDATGNSSGLADITDVSSLQYQESPPSYKTSQQDMLWAANPFESYPMASTSRDAYGVEDDDDDDDDVNPQKCGWGRFTPGCMKTCLNVKAYLIVFSMVSLVQLMTSYGLVTIAITSIERRFQLSSFKSGGIMSAYQFATMAFTVFVTYAGEHRHKPRWVGGGSLFLCLGSVVFTLPHFLSGDYVYQDSGGSIEGVCPVRNSSEVDMCSPDNENESGQDGDPSDYFWLFIVAQLFNSLASAPLFTLGVTFMDDNLSTKDFGLYMGIFNAIISLGPAIGIFIGVATLSIYTDVNIDPSSITITPDNPQWVGAWWLGFLISAIFTVILAFMLMAFPRSLPGMKKIQRERRTQSQKGSEFTARPGLGNSIRDFPRALAKVFTNIPFLCLCVIAATEYFIGAGLVTFLPKFMESQFNINSRDVGMYVGVLGMTAHLLGSLISGAIMKRFDLQFAGLMKLCIAAILASMVAGLIFIVHCPNVPLAGVSVHYINTSVPLAADEGGLVAECNSHCSCSAYFEPVCGEDHVMYFSPCHAGCSGEYYVDDELVYADCQCINSDANETTVYMYATDVPTSSDSPVISRTAVPGRCQTHCSNQWLYLVVLWIFSFCGSLHGIPAWISTMRCVSHSQRAFALGVQSLFYGGFGTAPAPIIFGLIIDRACIRWDMSSCDGKGACWMYDNETFAHSLLILVMCFKSVTLIFFFITLYCYKPAEDELDADDVYGPRRTRIPTTDL